MTRLFVLVILAASVLAGTHAYTTERSSYGWENTAASPSSGPTGWRTLPPDEGNVRLVGGSMPSEGRVEVQVNGVCGTVCDNDWNTASAHVVCRQLGYYGNVKVYKRSWYGASTGTIWMDGYHCRGQERRLVDCIDPARLGNHDCSHSEEAGVDCDPWTEVSTQSTPYWWWRSTDSLLTGSVRLVNGSRPSEGRVEVQVNGVWGTVCDDNWNTASAQVVCRQLGYNGINSSVTVYERSWFGGSTGPIWMDGYYCFGQERRFLDCIAPNHLGHQNCNHGEDAGVDCDPSGTETEVSTQSTPYWWWRSTDPSLLTGSIRLVAGSKPSEGRVEVQVNGTWGTVCDDNWNTASGQVVCRQLGYNGSVRVYYASWFGGGTGTIWMDGYRCFGQERRFLDCIAPNLLGHDDCSHREDAGVDCDHTRPTSTTPRSYIHRTTPFQPGNGLGPSIQLVSSPTTVVEGVTPSLTLACTPGAQENINRILLIQINHLVNDTKIPVADIAYGYNPQNRDSSGRYSVQGYVPSSGHYGAYLRLVTSKPTESECGQWECTVSALDNNYLSLHESATTTVNVQGMGFTALLTENTTVSPGQLHFHSVSVDTLGSFQNSQLHAPTEGLYFLSLTAAAISDGCNVTLALQHNSLYLFVLSVQSGYGNFGQNSASVVVWLERGDFVDVQALDYCTEGKLIAWPYTFFTGYKL